MRANLDLNHRSRTCPEVEPASVKDLKDPNSGGLPAPVQTMTSSDTLQEPELPAFAKNPGNLCNALALLKASVHWRQ